MADEVALGLNGKIIQAVAEFKFLIERAVAVGILQDRTHAAPPVLLRHTVDKLGFCHFLELLLFPAVHIVQQPECTPSGHFSKLHIDSFL